MARRLHIDRWVLRGSLVVAAWSALPAMQWCAMAWSDVTLRCLISDGPGCPAIDAPAPRAATSSCGARQCAASASCSAAACRTTPTPRDKRAWCLSPGSPRTVPTVASADAPMLLAVLPAPPPRPSPASSRSRPITHAARPPTSLARAPETIRGPPSS